MMHFIDAAKDGELLAELRDESILSPDITARIDEAMGRPESGTLNDFLLAGAEIIPERPWLSWLIRRHGCHRYGPVRWLDEAAAWVGLGPPPVLNLPYRRCADGSLLVAVLRPDRFREATEPWKPAVLHGAAATLGEIRALAKAWEAIIRRNGVLR